MKKSKYEQLNRPRLTVATETIRALASTSLGLARGGTGDPNSTSAAPKPDSCASR